MTSKDILTGRLRLVTISHPLMRADFTFDRPTFSRLLRAEIPSCWPPEHWEPHCFDFLQTMYTDHPHTYGWCRYVVLRARPSSVIGTVGAFPRSPGEAEIGYGVLPPWQRQGFATQAAQALLAALLEGGSVHTVTAQTFPHLTGSVRVMERCAMRLEGPGDEPGTIRYRLDQARSPPG